MVQPVGAASLQEVEGADVIGVDEGAGTRDRTIDVRLGGEMQDVGNIITLNDAGDGIFVAEVDFLKIILRVARHGLKVFKMTGVGEAVEVDERFNLGAIDKVLNYVGTDETGAAGDQKVHS